MPRLGFLKFNVPNWNDAAIQYNWADDGVAVKIYQPLAAKLELVRKTARERIGRVAVYVYDDWVTVLYDQARQTADELHQYIQNTIKQIIETRRVKYNGREFQVPDKLLWKLERLKFFVVYYEAEIDAHIYRWYVEEAVRKLQLLDQEAAKKIEEALKEGNARRARELLRKQEVLRYLLEAFTKAAV